MCKHQLDGGLGIKDLANFNEALLTKWLWRLVNETETIWIGLMKARYGALWERLVLNRYSGRRSKESLWWKDLLKLVDSAEVNCFFNFLSFKLGEGSLIPFWRRRWLGHRPL